MNVIITGTLLLIICSSLAHKNITRYCDRAFSEKKTTIFLKDEGVEANMIEVVDNKTKKIAFGYFLNAIRNDTNFIYSHIYKKDDTIINKTYHNYKITTGTDSIITKLICSPKNLRLYSSQRFWNGKIETDTVLNIILINY